MPVQNMHKWSTLSNTTLGVFMAALDSSIVIISLPAIFRGIDLNPLLPSNVGYLLWTLMGYMMCTAVLVVTLGKLGDMYGRVRMYNAGFVVFTLASIVLSLTPGTGKAAGLYIIIMRIVQGIGGALLMANSGAILTDAFPPRERGFAIGINQVAAIAGSFIGLVVGGMLAAVDWRLIFWINVPIGIFGTVWAYWKLKDTGVRKKESIDWWGNVTFGLGLVLLLVGITFGIQPYGSHAMGWTNPTVIAMLTVGLLLLAAFVFVELRKREPMFNMRLFRIRAFAVGNIASLLASVSRGGLQFMLIIWLQGIWLPLHGYSFESTPLWAGIYMLPTTIGFLIAAPVAGWLADRFGARPFAVAGMLLMAVTFIGLLMIPVNFDYRVFALLIFLNALGGGLFAAPNTAVIMSSVPPRDRGAASGVRSTFFNAGSALSIGVFFSLMVVGLAGTLPHALSSGLQQQGVPAAVAQDAAALPPVGSLFAAFLGYNPIAELLAPSHALQQPGVNAATLTGKSFFPELISGPFHAGLVVVFVAAALMMVTGALASLVNPGRYADDVEEI
ncbi:MAG TPA: MFS transporter [Candidatus Peribacteraceae bacterium]|nr:MFS transporter [Candidatus Peribacteraceae bacterium]